MLELDRSILILRPTEFCLDWINQLPLFESEPISLEEAQDDSTAVLVPLFEEDEELMDYLESIYDEIFEAELSAWCDDENTWPRERTFTLFTEWFDIEICQLVFDTEDSEDCDDAVEEPDDDSNEEY